MRVPSCESSFTRRILMCLTDCLTDFHVTRSRFSALKHDIDLAVDTVTASTTAEGEAARLISRALPLSDPLPPAKCPLTGPDLDLAMERHNSDSEKLDQLDVGDFDQLRSLAKGMQASARYLLRDGRPC